MNNPATPKERIPPDIFTDPMQLTVPTIPQNKKGKGKAAVDQIGQSKKGENSQNNVTNYTISYSLVNHLLETLLESEKDKEVQIAVQQQLEILDAIKEFKVLGKKEKLEAISSKQVEQKVAENVAVSQLQSQVQNLEKSVENKFNLILKSIETKSQDQSQNQAQFQSQIQAQIQTQMQPLNEIKSYAQAAADNSHTKEKDSQISLQKR